MNSVILLGRLVADPELKTTNTGKEVTNFRIAVDKPYQKGSEREADFFDIVAWGKTAVFVSQYFKKGKPIVVVGSLQTRSYEAKDGSKRHVTEVLANNIEFVPASKNDGYTATQGTLQPNYAAPDVPAQADSLLDEPNNQVGAGDDLPF